jgi:hypothetical protein
LVAHNLYQLLLELEGDILFGYRIVGWVVVLRWWPIEVVVVVVIVVAIMMVFIMFM